MLKKSLIGVTLTSLLAVSVQAVNPGTSPYLPMYKPPEACVIPVTIDVGMYVEILDCEKLSIKLEPVTSETYQGCTDIRIRSNFNLELGCDVEPTGNVPGDYSCSIDEPKVPLTLYGMLAVRKICVSADNVKFGYVAPGFDVHVADVTITVKPDL
ncbi:MAG: hypothetical protein PVJ86_01150 [Phycisphaerales bacterium]